MCFYVDTKTSLLNYAIKQKNLSYIKKNNNWF